MLLQKADIPRHGFFNALLDGVLRVVAQQIVGFADIGLRMAYVTGTEVAVNRVFLVLDTVFAQALADVGEQLVQGGTTADGDVVHLIARFFSLNGCRQQVGLYSVFNETEVAAGFAVAIDE